MKNEIEDVIGIEAQEAPLISAKNGIGIDEVLEQIDSINEEKAVAICDSLLGCVFFIRLRPAWEAYRQCSYRTCCLHHCRCVLPWFHGLHRT